MTNESPSFPRTQSRLAFEMQFVLDRFQKAEIGLLDVLETHRRHMREVAVETLSVAVVKTPTKKDFKDSPHWAECVDQQRMDVENKGQRYLLGV